MGSRGANIGATILGIMTSVCTAWATLDLETIDFHHPKIYFKLIIIAMPAVGGYISELKKK